VGADRYEGEACSATDEETHSVRDQYLAAFCRVTHSRRHSHREPGHVALVGRDLSRVDSDTYTDPTTGVGLAVVERDAFLNALTGDYGVY
jgi:hypothetical protein